jgi:hypothetical protein
MTRAKLHDARKLRHEDKTRQVWRFRAAREPKISPKTKQKGWVSPKFFRRERGVSMG